MDQAHPLIVAPGPSLLAAAEVSAMVALLLVGLSWLLASLWAVRS